MRQASISSRTTLVARTPFDRELACLLSPHARTRAERPAIAVGVLRSELGPLLAACRGEAIVMLQFLGSASDLRGALARLRRAFAPAEDRDALGEIERELRDYLDGEAEVLSRPVDLCLVRGSFQRAALRQLAGLPVGSVTTYRGLAAAVGAPEAARAIGQAMHDNPVPVYVPCHRVVRSDRTLGGYAAGLAIKIFLLRREGFHIDERRGTIEPALVGSLARKTFCRPGCQAANGATLFFATVSAARRAGLQPCRRCL